jgi:hypothetical protein
MPGHALFGVQGAARLSDGRIAIANGGSSEVRFFSQAGQLVATAGRQGRGPQEFQRIQAFARGAADSLVVLSGDVSIVVVSPTAEVVSKTPLGWAPLRFECRIAEGGILIAADRSLILQAEENRGIAGCPPMLDGRTRNTDILARLDPSDLTVDTLGIFPGTERDGPRYAAFGRVLAVAVSDDRIFAGETGGDSIVVFSLDGFRQTTWHAPLDETPIPDAVRAHQPEPFQRRDGSIVTPDPYTFEHVYPRFGRLVPDHLGHLWIMAYPQLAEPIASIQLTTLFSPVVDPEGARWTVLGPDGSLAATVQTPPGLYVLEIGEDYILGLVRDELDVESVRLYALDR